MCGSEGVWGLEPWAIILLWEAGPALTGVWGSPGSRATWGKVPVMTVPPHKPFYEARVDEVCRVTTSVV